MSRDNDHRFIVRAILNIKENSKDKIAMKKLHVPIHFMSAQISETIE